jgi:hypothetical protein
MGYWLWVIGYGSLVMGHWLWVIGYGSLVMGHWLWVIGDWVPFILAALPGCGTGCQNIMVPSPTQSLNTKHILEKRILIDYGYSIADNRSLRNC